jgi:hypothetical protein
MDKTAARLHPMDVTSARLKALLDVEARRERRGRRPRSYKTLFHRVVHSRRRDDSDWLVLTIQLLELDSRRDDWTALQHEIDVKIRLKSAPQTEQLSA